MAAPPNVQRAIALNASAFGAGFARGPIQSTQPRRSDAGSNILAECFEAGLEGREVVKARESERDPSRTLAEEQREVFFVGFVAETGYVGEGVMVNALALHQHRRRQPTAVAA